jgi:hypothetical protein
MFLGLVCLRDKKREALLNPLSIVGFSTSNLDSFVASWHCLSKGKEVKYLETHHKAFGGSRAHDGAYGYYYLPSFRWTGIWA